MRLTTDARWLHSSVYLELSYESQDTNIVEFHYNFRKQLFKKQHSDLKSLMIVFFFFATPVIQVTQILSQSKVAYEKRSCMFVQNLQKEIND